MGRKMAAERHVSLLAEVPLASTALGRDTGTFATTQAKKDDRPRHLGSFIKMTSMQAQ